MRVEGYRRGFLPLVCTCTGDSGSSCANGVRAAQQRSEVDVHRSLREQAVLTVICTVR